MSEELRSWMAELEQVHSERLEKGLQESVKLRLELNTSLDEVAKLRV